MEKTEETRWNPDTPFGFCPVCGASGIKTTKEDDKFWDEREAHFFCSSSQCFFNEGRTYWCEKRPEKGD